MPTTIIWKKSALDLLMGNTLTSVWCNDIAGQLIEIQL